MAYVALNTAVSITGLSKRTLWRRIADGQLRVHGIASGAGEHTRVLESHRLDVENEVAVIYSPAVGNFFVLFPTSSATI